jgi:hypothetical protein
MIYEKEKAKTEVYAVYSTHAIAKHLLSMPDELVDQVPYEGLDIQLPDPVIPYKAAVPAVYADDPTRDDQGGVRRGYEEGRYDVSHVG